MGSMSKPEFFKTDRYKEIKRHAAKETRAIVSAIKRLQKIFEVQNFTHGFEGDQFAKNESTLVFKLKSTYDKGK